jgi:signal transduction histidine kinase
VLADFTYQTDNLYFVIRDNGYGIPAGDLKKVGKVFYSTKSAGSGVGLTVSQTIIAAHKGQFDFLSKAGEGTIVINKLPVCQPEG